MNGKSIIDKELDELYKKTAEGEKKGIKAAKYRRIIAYVLKIIAAGASLVIATGKLAFFHQEFGIAVLVAIFVDTISSNHKRLLAVVQAGYAYRSLRSAVRGEFNRELDPLIRLVRQGDTTGEQKIKKLKDDAHVALSEGISKIEEKLSTSNIEALKSLSLDQERTLLPS